jgi:hypothetical protein
VTLPLPRNSLRNNTDQQVAEDPTCERGHEREQHDPEEIEPGVQAGKPAAQSERERPGKTEYDEQGAGVAACINWRCDGAKDGHNSEAANQPTWDTRSSSFGLPRLDDCGDDAGLQVIGVAADPHVFYPRLQLGRAAEVVDVFADCLGRIQHGHVKGRGVIPAAASDISGAQLVVGEQTCTAVGVVNDCEFEPVRVRGLVRMKMDDPGEILYHGGRDPTSDVARHDRVTQSEIEDHRGLYPRIDTGNEIQLFERDEGDFWNVVFGVSSCECSVPFQLGSEI